MPLPITTEESWLNLYKKAGVKQHPDGQEFDQEVLGSPVQLSMRSLSPMPGAMERAVAEAKKLGDLQGDTYSLLVSSPFASHHLDAWEIYAPNQQKSFLFRIVWSFSFWIEMFCHACKSLCNNVFFFVLNPGVFDMVLEAVSIQIHVTISPSIHPYLYIHRCISQWICSKAIQTCLSCLWRTCIHYVRRSQCLPSPFMLFLLLVEEHLSWLQDLSFPAPHIF